MAVILAIGGYDLVGITVSLLPRNAVSPPMDSNIAERVLLYIVRHTVSQTITAQWLLYVDCVWNVMAHAQKPDFVFRRKGQVHLNRRGGSVLSTAGSRVVRIGGINVGYTMFRGSVKSTGYPIHSPVSPSLPLPCITVCHHISAGLDN